MFFNDTATTEIYTLSLHDALPISLGLFASVHPCSLRRASGHALPGAGQLLPDQGRDGRLPGGIRRPLRPPGEKRREGDRKSTRLNSSHANISYAVFCLKKKKTHNKHYRRKVGLSQLNLSSRHLTATHRLLQTVQPNTHIAKLPHQYPTTLPPTCTTSRH